MQYGALTIPELQEMMPEWKLQDQLTRADLLNVYDLTLPAGCRRSRRALVSVELSCVAATIVLQLYLKPAVRISFQVSFHFA